LRVGERKNLQVNTSGYLPPYQGKYWFGRQNW